MNSIRERAEKFWRNVPVVHRPIEEILAEFALAERRLQRQECAEAFEKSVGVKYPTIQMWGAAVVGAILAAGEEEELSPFGCQCWHRSKGSNKLWHKHTDGHDYSLYDGYTHCPFCGKARQESQ